MWIIVKTEVMKPLERCAKVTFISSNCHPHTHTPSRPHHHRMKCAAATVWVECEFEFMMMSWFILFLFLPYARSLACASLQKQHIVRLEIKYKNRLCHPPPLCRFSRWNILLAPIDDTFLGVSSEWIVVISICMILMMVACGVGISICICRRNTNRNVALKSQMAMTTCDVNGQKHLNFYRPAVLGELYMVLFTECQQFFLLE